MRTREARAGITLEHTGQLPKSTPCSWITPILFMDSREAAKTSRTCTHDKPHKCQHDASNPNKQAQTTLIKAKHAAAEAGSEYHHTPMKKTSLSQGPFRCLQSHGCSTTLSTSARSQPPAREVFHINSRPRLERSFLGPDFAAGSSCQVAKVRICLRFL